MASVVRMLLVIAVTVTSSGPAIADDEIAKPTSQEARDRLTAGTRLYRLREFEKAIEEYKAGALKEDAPVFYYNLGQCYRQLGRYEDAIWHYQRFLDRADPLPTKYKKAVEDFIHDMRAELDKKAMTRPPTEPAPDTKLTADPKPAAPMPQVVTMVERGDAWYDDALGWGITGTGVVAGGVSLWLLFDAKRFDEDANKEPSQDTQNALRNRASERRLAGTIVGIVGGVALVTGIIKLAIAPKDRTATVMTSLDVGLTSNGFFVAGRF